MDVLIFDDDPYSAEIAEAVLSDHGFSVDKFLHAHNAMEIIRRVQPRMVILDIMMPGVDGLSLCKAIQEEPRTAAIPVVVVSGKAYEQDKQEALRCGARAFVPKPFDAEQLRTVLLEVLGRMAAPSTTPRARDTAFRVVVWGSRGACVSVRIGERLLILDAGAGLRDLCAASLSGEKDIWLLLTHYQQDHVEGLPSLLSALKPDLPTPLRIGGPSDTRQPLTELVRAARPGPGAAQPQLQLFGMSESRNQLWPDVRVTGLLTRHPGTTLAYRVEHKERTVVYCPDNELETDEDTQTDFPEKFSAFVRGADLLIHDARYLDEDAAKCAGQGHSHPSAVVELAREESLRRLALFHMDACYDAVRLNAAVLGIRKRLADALSPLSVELALPGATFDV